MAFERKWQKITKESFEKLPEEEKWQLLIDARDSFIFLENDFLGH
jgi:hypothetical protein